MNKCWPRARAWQGQGSLYQSAWAAITKHHRPGGLDNKNVLSHGSGDRKSKVKVPAELVSGEGSLLELQTAAFLLYIHVACPL